MYVQFLITIVDKKLPFINWFKNAQFRSNLYQVLSVRFFREVMNYAETSGFAGTVDWAQLDLQIIQLRDYFGHLSIFTHENF